ncbi:MAG: hypothetical protein LBL28_08510, partial [Treponema sp.]|nr:hypothetical protein [Treponema sp.]
GNPVDGTELAEKKLRTSTIFLISSGVVTLAQIAVGFVRPFTYDTALAKKNSAYAGLDTNPLEHINIAIVPDKNGPAALNLSYSFSY